MKVAVIGAGAIGCLYGGYLTRSGEEVWLLDVWEEHVNKIRKSGLTLVSPTELVEVHPRATTNVDDIGGADLVMVCVKSPTTAQAAMIAEILLRPQTTVLTLQNGIGNAEQLAEMLGAERIIVGATTMGAIVLEPGHVMFGGIRPTYIASWTGNGDRRYEKIAAALSCAGLPTTIENNVTSLLWSKLVIHAGINAVTALTRVTNGQLLDMEEPRELAIMAVKEAEAVAMAAGISLLYPSSVDELFNYAKAMREHRSSMLQDVLHKRVTEVNAINGAVVRAGSELGVPTPVNRTLTLALNTIEKMYGL